VTLDNEIGIKKALLGITALFTLSVILLTSDSAKESELEYYNEKRFVEKGLEELSQVLNALEYNISVLYPLHNEQYVLPHIINLQGITCNFGGVSQQGEDYDFLFSGPASMCDPSSSLYQEAYRRLFIAPSMAYFTNAFEKISSIYFLSKDKFIISSPKEFAQAIKGDTFDSIVMNRPYWINTVRYGLTQQQDRVVFTGNYEDYLTGEKVVTVTRGVYIDGEFKGVLAIDSYLNDLLQDTMSGYQLSDTPGPNYRDLVSFTFSAPVIIGEQYTGLYLNVNEPKREHIFHILQHDKDALILLFFGYVIGLAFIWYNYTQTKHARLHELAMKDPLTGLANRRGFEHRLKNLVESQYFAIAVFDIDNFKRINDEHGHDEGDLVIMHVGQSITNSVRRQDIVARFGGEEFVVAVSGESDVLVSSILERIQREISLQPYRLPTGNQKFISASGGGVIYKSNHFEGSMHIWSNQGIRRADQLLYQAKANGKDRIVIEQQ
tara:strand:- start:1741 stop:3219 length:1479 start_codon:yes stop_codon:yes gene_type:complete